MTDDKTKPAAGADDQEQKPVKKKRKLTGTVKGAGYVPDTEHPAAVVIDAVADQTEQEDIDIKKVLEATAESFSNLDIQKMMQDASKRLDATKIMQDASKAMAATDTDKIIADLLLHLRDLADELKDLQPYIDAELQKPEYKGKSFADLHETTEDGSTLFAQLIRAAKEAKAAKEADIEAAPNVTARKARAVEYPLDKPNSYIWDLIQTDTKGQIEFNLAKYGSKEVIPAYYSINFDGLSDELQITKKLQPFDKRVYIAVSALFNAGNNVITLSQIHYAMGGTTRPGGKILSKINDAITKMTTARILFDNEREAEKYKYNHFKYDGSLLPIERGTAIVNGQLADAAIHIFREPPLITFAKQRNQITTIDIKLLQSPVNKTDDNLRIDDYLIERISRAKNGKSRSCRILYKTLYEHAGIADKPKTNTERQQKKRAPEKIKKYLDHYQKTGFISRYTVEKDGLTIHW